MAGKQQTPTSVLEALRRELAPVEAAIRSHAFLEQLGEGSIPRERLRAFAGEQQAIVASDRRSFALLASRFPHPPAGDLFLALAQGEGEALARLSGFSAWLGMGDEDLRAYEPQPGCQAYAAYVAWLALNGSQADVALAFLLNLDAWGANCARVAKALRARYGAPDEAVAFFDYFAGPPGDFPDRLLEVVEAGLEQGDSPAHARRAARFLQAYELRYWDTLAGGL